jgi:hypothetical protein
MATQIFGIVLIAVAVVTAVSIIVTLVKRSKLPKPDNKHKEE